MLRMRLRLIKIRTMIKNVVRSSLAKLNVKLKHNDIWNGEGEEELKDLVLEDPYQEVIDQCSEIVGLMNCFVEIWEKKIRKAVKCNEEALNNCSLLKTHPKIGDISAFTILYESGSINRFHFPDKYVAYVGLAPKTRGSADKYRTGHLSKQANMYLKWIYVKAATHVIRIGKERLWDYYQKEMHRKGKSVVKIALARKITTGCYYILKNRIDYTTFLKRETQTRRLKCKGIFFKFLVDTFFYRSFFI